ncbi:hypothetical protein Tsubulata_018122 [Turnera subulata]|uniref:RNA polymerase sigma-70 domain-containing protein n=1 Tax=Turnera subulata TaxID=218843 RepID=A0A9Q0JE26_9ROSI|nr:hypothetical protein Tsubulata_018122 [Turnera subulata]
MGVEFRLSLKQGFPVHTSSVNNSTSWFSSSLARGREGSVNVSRLPSLSLVSEEGYNYPLKRHASSSAVQTLESDCSLREGLKVNIDKRSIGGLNKVVGDGELPVEEGVLYTSLEQRGSSRFNLLIENLDALEKSLADSEALKLERDILQQLGRLGAVKLLDNCLSRSFEISNILGLSDVPTENIEECKTNGAPENHKAKVFVRSGKKEERKRKRESGSSVSGCNPSKSKSRTLRIPRNETGMAKGAKMASQLERIKINLGEETGQVVSFSCWAEAAGLDRKELQQRLRFGWYCRDELIKSTRSLVLYIAKSYWGAGITLDDLIQAGRLGVLQGAERFDHTRGIKFSTYVTYWIRKSMSRMVEQNGSAIQIPSTLIQAKHQITKARKALRNSNGKRPNDTEIAKFTGLSLAKIKAASECLRVVGSIDQKIGDLLNVEISETIPDTSTPSGEQEIIRQQMREEIYNILRGLDPRELQVLTVRYGFGGHQPKSLGETSRLLHISKEWVRRIEKKAIMRLRNEETVQNLRHYYYEYL